MSLRVEAARKVFRAHRGAQVVALDGVDLEAANGELLVIVGPSGSGKSTLLRAIAGLEPLDSGRVVIGERDVTGVPAGRRDVAMVFQEAALFPHLSVAANIGIGERARGAKRRDVAARVGEVARGLGVDHLLRRMPGQLSGGERQRVALARVMIRVPSVCLLDEPLASVDAELRLRMRGEIRAVQRSLGVPMVHVTHDQLEAMAMGDRVAVMDGGRVLQCDTPVALYDRPATMAVARIVGPLPMNLLPEAAGVIVGVRPERLRVCRDGGGRTGTVTAVEPAGEECLVRIQPGDVQPDSTGPDSTGPSGAGPAGAGAEPGEVRPRSELLARVGRGGVVEVGERVSWGWRAEDEHRFDAVTGRRR